MHSVRIATEQKKKKKREENTINIQKQIQTLMQTTIK